MKSDGNQIAQVLDSESTKEHHRDLSWTLLPVMIYFQPAFRQHRFN